MNANETLQQWGREPDVDPRFNIGLLADVITLLRKHGYVEAPGTAANVLVELRSLVLEFEGGIPKVQILQAGGYKMTAVEPDVSLHRCIDCEHNLGNPLRALDAPCPLWGEDRSKTTIRCAVFVPKL